MENLGFPHLAKGYMGKPRFPLFSQIFVSPYKVYHIPCIQSYFPVLEVGAFHIFPKLTAAHPRTENSTFCWLGGNSRYRCIYSTICASNGGIYEHDFAVTNRLSYLVENWAIFLYRSNPRWHELVASSRSVSTITISRSLCVVLPWLKSET